MLYNYLCSTCLAEAEKRSKSDLSFDEVIEAAVFETEHAMNPTPAELGLATQCPVCGGHDTAKTLMGSNITGFVRGRGFSDVSGRRRDRDKYLLTEADAEGKSQDPYAEHRTSGETTDLIHKLDKDGKYNPKSKVFVMPKSSQ